MSGGDELKTLKRGLEALSFLNSNGLTNLATLARHLDMPRANAYRLLKTLVTEGYVNRIPNSRLYIVSPRVRELSNGLQTEELLTTVCMPIIEKLGREIKWPVAIATPRGINMLVRLATDVSTPLALMKARPGLQTPMVMTTTGVLYLALQQQAVRTELLSAIRQSGDYGPHFANAIMLEEAMRFARDNHYLILDVKFPEASLGVPLIHEGRPVGGLVMRYIKAGVTRARAIEEFLPRLRQAAQEITEGFARASHWVAAGAVSEPLVDRTMAEGDRPLCE